ncbi:S9 family peptidase [Aurantiacibacter luteus]|uniref:Peptidase n=1 Tax=Aurantiacibacter luteus TaxID=1581420 RepID=A0A0G9MXI0_9SPHN|nr:prolyl oligopeptidase family serine peptidase [Aurantiacibacter luteus]KLE35264.1 peptidase [Aurantiacibacter luteus]
MRLLVPTLAALLASTSAFAQDAADASVDVVVKPAAITADGIPPVPAELAEATRPYFEYRTAGFSGWNAQDRSMIIGTRFGDTNQIHRVAAPGGARTQLTFEEEPIGGASYSPDGSLLLIEKDIGGNEFDQLYRYDNGRLVLLTDGTSRNGLGAWMEDGSMVAFSSTKRNGRDTDLYLMDPRDPATTRLLAEREGGGWFVADFTPDGRQALVGNYISVQQMDLYLIDLATGAERRVTDPASPASFSGIQFDPAGRLWVTTDAGSDFKQLGTLNLATGAFTPVVEEAWDIAGFDISEDGSFIAYGVNAAGLSQLKVLDVASGTSRAVDLPPGVLGNFEIAPWGEIGLTFSSNQAASDAYSVNPQTLALTRWTQSETGGLDPARNALPELVEIASFDGERMSGLLYRPDPARFPGPRPLVMSIHGGPEGQSTAGFLGRNNYMINELGVALFLPNVRGSTGFGKRFVSLDNGPFQRENSVQDIGAFLDALEADPGIDADRMMVSGGSYGGYMCYASAIRYGDRFDAASCVVAISNFVTFLENTESYRRDLRRVEYGDERDPAQRAQLMAISPLTRIEELDIPLMVATGANDPRVPASEADQVITAVRANGREAWHFLAANEGHGFARKENADYYTWANLMFIQRHLLGAD